MESIELSEVVFQDNTEVGILMPVGCTDQEECEVMLGKLIGKLRYNFPDVGIRILTYKPDPAEAVSPQLQSGMNTFIAITDVAFSVHNDSVTLLGIGRNTGRATVSDTVAGGGPYTINI